MSERDARAPAPANATALRTPPAPSVALLAAAGFFGAAALRVCDPLLPRLAADFDRTAGASGMVVVGFAIAYGLMQLVFGPLADRYGKGRLMAVALLGCCVGAGASSIAPGFDALVWTRVIWGMAAAGIVPLAMAWVADAVPYDRRQATLARLLGGTLTGMVAGQLLGGLFAESAVGWRGAFVCLSLGYGVMAALMLRQVARSPAPVSATDAASPLLGRLALIPRTPWARVVLLAVALEGALLVGPLAYLPTYLHQTQGLSLVMASLLAALYAVGGLFYAVFARRLVAALGEGGMTRAGGGFIGLGFAGLWLLPFPAAAAGLILLIGFGTFLFHNTLQTHATQMVPTARGTAVSMFACFLFTSQAVGAWLAGLAIDRVGFAPVIWVPALTLPLVGAAFAWALRRR